MTLQFGVVLLLLILAGGYILLARYFFTLIGELRQENRELLSRLLLKNNIEPLVIERERVVKLPDPETQPERTAVDEAFRMDEIKEMLEESFPDAAFMTHEEAKEAYARDWARLEKRWDEARTPLRAG